VNGCFAFANLQVFQLLKERNATIALLKKRDATIAALNAAAVEAAPTRKGKKTKSESVPPAPLEDETGVLLAVVSITNGCIGFYKNENSTNGCIGST
jgi:hypothetical protein